MKKIGLLLAVLAFQILSTNAQNFNNGIGVHFNGLDFYGPQTGQYFLQDKLNETDQKTQKKLFWEPAVRVSFWHAFSKHFDLVAGLNASAFQYPSSDKDSTYINAKNGRMKFKNETAYASADAKLHFNFLPKATYFISPYICGGISGSIREEEIGLNLPLGAGLNVHLGKGIFLNLESNYQMAIAKTNQNHLSHSIGVVYWWARSKKQKMESVKEVATVQVKDTDNDGIPDSEDACPTQAGKREMQGCPDKDGDGIVDKDDLCPEVAGLKNYNGCPDKDGDGVQDNKDNCPDVAGIAKYRGCPIPDTDKDGFNDEVDKCPEVASSVNSGCPEIKQEDKQKIEMAAQGVNFETGSAVISKASFSNLDKIVEILKNQPTYLVDIEGHTDNVGQADKNLELSQKRADACKSYLIDKGISTNRINSVGFGDMKPIEPNTTKVGRAKNRRTEFNIKSF